MDTTDIILTILKVLAFAPAIIIHECAHGFVAWRLGDTTAKDAGRLSLNPIRHIDLWGTIIIPGLLILSGSGFFFGYAKPVPVNPRRFKNMRMGELYVSLAGPGSNIIMALIGAAIANGVVMFCGGYTELLQLAFYKGQMWWYYICFFGLYFCSVNLCLAFFNVIPIPPLDGSSIIVPFLSNNALRTYYKVQQYGMFILLLFVLVIPYIFPQFDILGIYLNATAGNLLHLLAGFAFS